MKIKLFLKKNEDILRPKKKKILSDTPSDE